MDGSEERASTAEEVKKAPEKPPTWQELLEDRAIAVQVINFVLSVIVGLAIAYFRHPSPTILGSFAEGDGVFATIISFFALEIVFFIFLIDRMRRVFLTQDESFGKVTASLSSHISEVDRWRGRHSEDLRIGLKNHAAVIRQQSALVHTGFKLFQHSETPVHRATRRAVMKIAADIHVSGDAITAQGGDLSQDIYHKFWEEIYESQKDAPRECRAAVFAIHSSSLDYWSDKHFQDSMNLQKEFASKGGTLFRVMVHDRSIDQKPKPASDDVSGEGYARLIDEAREARLHLYESLIREMISGVPKGSIRVFYLDSEELVRDADEVQLSRLGEEHHFLLWGRDNKTYIPDEYERNMIASCTFKLTGEGYDHGGAENWLCLIEALCKRSGSGDGSPLRTKPTVDDLVAMEEIMAGHGDLKLRMSALIRQLKPAGA